MAMIPTPHDPSNDDAGSDASPDLREVAAPVGDMDEVDDVGDVVPVGAAPASFDELKKVLAAELSTDSTQHYLNQIGTRALLTVAQEVHYATLAKQGDFEARQVMIEHNQALTFLAMLTIKRRTLP